MTSAPAIPRPGYRRRGWQRRGSHRLPCQRYHSIRWSMSIPPTMAARAHGRRRSMPATTPCSRTPNRSAWMCKQRQRVYRLQGPVRRPEPRPLLFGQQQRLRQRSIEAQRLRSKGVADAMATEDSSGLPDVLPGDIGHDRYLLHADLPLPANITNQFGGNDSTVPDMVVDASGVLHVVFQKQRPHGHRT